MEFKDEEDVWKIVDMIVEEAQMMNAKTNRKFDIVMSVASQIPFFACKNMFLDKFIQKDIKRYIYCKENSISPYPGSFDEQPYIWVEKYFIMKNAFAKLEKSMIDKKRSQEKG